MQSTEEGGATAYSNASTFSLLMYRLQHCAEMGAHHSDHFTTSHFVKSFPYLLMNDVQTDVPACLRFKVKDRQLTNEMSYLNKFF